MANLLLNIRVEILHADMSFPIMWIPKHSDWILNKKHLPETPRLEFCHHFCGVAMCNDSLARLLAALAHCQKTVV